MGLVDVELKKKSRRIKVVKKYLNKEEKGEWKETMKYFLNKCGEVNLGDSVLWMKMKEWMFKRVPDFYKKILKAWGLFLSKVHFEPEGWEIILDQPLFYGKLMGEKFSLKKMVAGWDYKNLKTYCMR